MNDWTLVSDAVKQLLELVDERHFKLDRIVINSDSFNENTLVVAAFDKKNYPFDYAMYVTPNNIEADGY